MPPNPAKCAGPTFEPAAAARAAVEEPTAVERFVEAASQVLTAEGEGEEEEWEQHEGTAAAGDKARPVWQGRCNSGGYGDVPFIQ